MTRTNHLSHSVVEYASYDDMKCAMRKLNGAELNGRKLKLHEDYRGSRRKTCVCVQSSDVRAFIRVWWICLSDTSCLSAVNEQNLTSDAILEFVKACEQNTYKLKIIAISL